MFKNRELFYNIFLTAVIKIPNTYSIIKWYFSSSGKGIHRTVPRATGPRYKTKTCVFVL